MLDKRKPIYSKKDANTPIQKFCYTMQWYNTIMELDMEDKLFVIGGETATIDDFKKRALERIQERFWHSYNQRIKEVKEELGTEFDEDHFNQEYTEDMHDSGYSGVDEVEKLESFWKNVTKEDLMEPFGELDRINYEGHRHYFFSQSNLEPLYFNYMVNELGINTTEDLEKHLEENYYEQEDSLYSIMSYFVPDNFQTFTPFEIEEMYMESSTKTQKEDRERFNYMIGNILKEFGDDPLFSSKIKDLEKLKF